MPAWKNITLNIPHEDLDQISESISAINSILAITIIDKLSDRQSEWYEDNDRNRNHNGSSYYIKLLVPGLTNADKLIDDIIKITNLLKIELVSEEIFEDRDWIKHSKNQFKEIKISNQIRIIPPWIIENDFEGKTVIIDPGSGFGTGSHPTTQLCIKWIESHLSKNVSVLDYGCGSGILSIVAKTFGSGYTLGIDNDQQAIENAERNKNINSSKIELIHSNNYNHKKNFDIVIANILSNTIISLKDRLINSLQPSGKLILSGILNNQSSKVINHFYPDINLSIAGELEDWVLLYGET